VRGRGGRRRAGGRVTVADGFRPCAAGVSVRLQRRVAGRWRTLRRARTTSAGRFSVRLGANRRGLRVSVPVLVRTVSGRRHRCGSAAARVGR
jgi:hypothetical protein